MGRLGIAGKIIKAATADRVISSPTGQFLPAPDCGIDIGRIQLQPEAAGAGSVGRDDSRATAEKGVQDDVAARRAVKNGIGDQSYRLDGRAYRQQLTFFATAPERVCAGIVPDVAPVAPELAELDVVAMAGR